MLKRIKETTSTIRQNQNIIEKEQGNFKILKYKFQKLKACDF